MTNINALKEKHLKRDLVKIISLKLNLEKKDTPKTKFEEAEKLIESLSIVELQDIKRHSSNIAETILKHVKTSK